jgi:hypothetical protein
MADTGDMFTEQELPPDETVYRRIAESNAKDWIQNGKVSANAFLPNRGDSDGLSFSRARTAQEAAETGRTGKRFYVVPVRVADIGRRADLKIVADSPTHAVIPGWTLQARDSDFVREGADHLAAHCGVPEGPFDGRS